MKCADHSAFGKFNKLLRLSKGIFKKSCGDVQPEIMALRGTL